MVTPSLDVSFFEAHAFPGVLPLDCTKKKKFENEKAKNFKKYFFKIWRKKKKNHEAVAGRADTFSWEGWVDLTSSADWAVGHSLLSNSRFTLALVFEIFQPFGSLALDDVGVPIGACKVCARWCEGICF